MFRLSWRRRSGRIRRRCGRSFRPHRSVLTRETSASSSSPRSLLISRILSQESLSMNPDCFSLRNSCRNPLVSCSRCKSESMRRSILFLIPVYRGSGAGVEKLYSPLMHKPKSRRRPIVYHPQPGRRDQVRVKFALVSRTRGVVFVRLWSGLIDGKPRPPFTCRDPSRSGEPRSHQRTWRTVNRRDLIKTGPAGRFS